MSISPRESPSISEGLPANGHEIHQSYIRREWIFVVAVLPARTLLVGIFSLYSEDRFVSSRHTNRDRHKTRLWIVPCQPDDATILGYPFNPSARWLARRVADIYTTFHFTHCDSCTRMAFPGWHRYVRVRAVPITCQRPSWRPHRPDRKRLHVWT